ncbi:putative protein S-acyltransferase [Helianthus anomalus]
MLSPSCLMVVLCLIPRALTCHCLSSEEESSQHQTSEDGIFFCSMCEVEVRLTFEVKLSFSDFKLDVMSWKFEINCISTNKFAFKYSKHCRVCDKRVDRFDHHCRWLNNCVGKKNYKKFFTLMVSALLLAWSNL